MRISDWSSDLCSSDLANKLAPYLARKYPQRHAIQSDAALYDYTLELKQNYLRSSSPLHKVIWQNKMDVMTKVLGLHTAVSRVQGARPKAKAQIRSEERRGEQECVSTCRSRGPPLP